MDTAPTYLVVIDDSAESRVALRFAALRAGHVGAKVAMIHVIPTPEFMQWGAVQEAMEAEARAEADKLLSAVADEAEALSGTRPRAIVLNGDAAPTIFDHVRGDPSVRALVLGAAPKGTPGPLIGYFTGERAGQLPCVVMLVPGGLAQDRLESLT
ncbi:universal stress protein [Polymorphobacter fuscus]|uniref:Universal stress protein n=1 Tax=Sandarakinorhabdus fusca TaxID=1439888 RepID=A0A7C9GQW5_9SPHN|nr:universal stress protein [Polymorphobacter fuscus]KAB7645603.1 universal stress protein [Polymorphobacter fuscus]MQT18053.1 universal stress protein [Polymorphobacter fuscus]NJC08686.1 nucleotide-binding universal stress UspA family protein [Polymorphobacter fuscus]